MIINENLKKNLLDFSKYTDLLSHSSSLTDTQLEKLIKNLEKIRYNIITEIKIYNQNKEFEYEKIKTIDSEYNAEFTGGILKIYVPEVMPSYKTIKTHSSKHILLNIAEVAKQYAGCFDDWVFIYIKIYDKILGWDIDNKYIKPVADGLILANIIQDDNLSKMFYCAKGEFSENPHTEIYVFDSKKVSDFLDFTTTGK